MPTYRLNSTKTAVVNVDQPNLHFTAAAVEDLNRFGTLFQSRLLFGFAAPDDSVLFKPITKVKPYYYIDHVGEIGSTDAVCFKAPFDPTTATLNSVNFWKNIGSQRLFYGASTDSKWTDFAKEFNGDDAICAVEFGISVDGIDCAIRTSLASSSRRPYLIVTHEAEDVPPSVLAVPRTGYRAKNKPSAFSWSLYTAAHCVGTYTQVSAVFRWRTQAGATEHTVNLGAGVTGYTMPAGTVSSDSYQWKVDVTTQTGAVASSEWFTISTVEPLAAASPIYPTDTVVDGTADTVFRWQHRITTGTAPSGADIQTSADGTAWTSFAHVTGAATEYTVAGGTLSSGTLYWRVRSYNQEGRAGPWSDAVSCIVIAAPAAPVVSATTLPRPSVSWQAEAQQAAEVSIDGEIRHLWGMDKQLMWHRILDDGEHIVRVRVQNAYGLWSMWGEAPIRVQNVPGSAITLRADGDYMAQLSWETAGRFDSFVIFRNGEVIAVTSDLSYSDNYGSGDVLYQVYGLMSNGFYSASNTAAITLRSDILRIYSVSDDSWIHLPLSDDQFAAVKDSASVTGVYYHVTGSDYPVAEISRYKDRLVSVYFSLIDAASVRFVRALVGKHICVKAPGSDPITGIVLSLESSANAFYTSFDLQIQQVAEPEVMIP